MRRTRLDRLLSLLESGSSKDIRNAAARQLGEYVRLTPTDSPSILTKVSIHGNGSNRRCRRNQLNAALKLSFVQLNTLLRSKSWDTRIAAADALQYLLEKLSQRDAEAAQFGAPPKRSGATLHLDRLNLDALIRKRAVLLGCAASVFEAQNEVTANGKSASAASVSPSFSPSKSLVVHHYRTETLLLYEHENVTVHIIGFFDN